MKDSLKRFVPVKRLYEFLRDVLGPRGIIVNFIVFHLFAIVRILYSKICTKSYLEIKSLRKKYTNKRCFIVATGPSLLIEDLENLNVRGEITFGLNTIYKLYDKTCWRPDYYCCIDRELFNEIYKANGFGFIDFLSKRSSFVDYYNRFRVDRKRTVCVPYNRLSHETRFLKHLFFFSQNMIWGFYDAYTITNAAICIAMYMGFSEIYLLGVDGSYTQGAKYAKGLETTYTDRLTQVYYTQSERLMHEGYLYIREQAIRHNVKIFNASRGGLLNVFERKDLDSVL
jgi:hypothetical protein